MKKITDAEEIKIKGIEYCQMQHKQGKKERKRMSHCRNCPLHICIDSNGLIHASVMDFSDFVQDYNMMISEIFKEEPK